MKILVTGADGFIGSHLCEELIKNGHDVSALCFYNSTGSRGWLEYSKFIEDIEVILGDIRDQDICNLITRSVDTVINLAALISIPYSYVAPSSYFQTNVLGTINLCQAALKNDVTRFIQLSTSEVYGSALYTPIDEKHPIQPQSPYAASKVSSDSVVYSFARTYALPALIARPFNTFGPRQSIRAIIPTIITQILRKAPSVKLGLTKPIRDFNYVTNTTDALIKLITAKYAGISTLNIGSGTALSMQEVYETISNLMNYHGVLEQSQEKIRPENSEVNHLVCNFKKISEYVNYIPKIDFELGLKKTIAWFEENNLANYPMNFSHI